MAFLFDTDAISELLRQQNVDRLLTQAAGKLSENSFQKVWDDPEDADYDNL